MTRIILYFFFILLGMQSAFSNFSEKKHIRYNEVDKSITITVPDKKLSIVIDYSAGFVIKQLNIRARNVLSTSGIYTGIQTRKANYFSIGKPANIKVVEKGNRVTLSGLTYGDQNLTVDETWEFEVKGDRILWDIIRNYHQDAEVEDMAFPKYNFANMSVWKGGILDNGGMIWCKYLKQTDDTYGVHTGGVTFWNDKSGDGLRITTHPGEGHVVATKYSHSDKNEFTATQLVTDEPLGQRYDLSRFVAQKADVFAPFKIKKGKVGLSVELQFIDYFKTYSRGTLPGIDAAAVRELLNTTGRYGVVDNNIIGANGWLTNWKCLHEPFFAQMGMALGDKNYTQNMSATLNQERDLATLPNGRVLSRWHNTPGDEIPGTYNRKTGYYEAKWGYTIDSQTGYIINLSEQFDLNGDIDWLRSHQASGEKALEWLIKRDENNNGVFEMINNNIGEKKASDWLDIVWASYENAFVNAQMYEALNLWADCEKVLGNHQKSDYYTRIAARLKETFNKTVEQGGFWLQGKKQYVYWRDKDGSVHGDNLVTPVNFAAIAFGLCDDKKRITEILDQIAKRTTEENLFHWPLCFDSFKQDEVSPDNWPFPKYENGDIFPTWGYLGIRAYAGYDKGIALKFINNLLQQYQKDGLSSQRYSRSTQLGLGDDILAGIATSITALYRDIYGIRPKWNRMGLEPNLPAQINGTKFSYALRNTVYQLALSQGNYTMKTNGFSINCKKSFGANKIGNHLLFYPNNQEEMMMQINALSNKPVTLRVHNWEPGAFSWTISSADNYQFILKGLKPGACYYLLINNSPLTLKATSEGTLTFKKRCKTPIRFMVNI
jgi:hypothetical protein